MTDNQLPKKIQDSRAAVTRLIAGAPKCQCQFQSVTLPVCSLRTCEHGKHCQDEVRRLLGRLIFPVHTLFTHERATIAQLNSRSLLDSHTASCNEVRRAIDQAIAQLMTSSLDALDGINRFVEALQQHVDSTNAALLTDRWSGDHAVSSPYNDKDVHPVRSMGAEHDGLLDVAGARGA